MDALIERMKRYADNEVAVAGGAGAIVFDTLLPHTGPVGPRQGLVTDRGSQHGDDQSLRYTTGANCESYSLNF